MWTQFKTIFQIKLLKPSFQYLSDSSLKNYLSEQLKYTHTHKCTHIHTHTQCVCVLVAQLCLTLCNPMDCSISGSSVHGVPQARILVWTAIPVTVRIMPEMQKGMSDARVSNGDPVLQNSEMRILVGLVDACLGFKTLWLQQVSLMASIRRFKQAETPLLPFGTRQLRKSLSDLGDTHGKEPACQSRRHKRHRFDPCVRKIP